MSNNNKNNNFKNFINNSIFNPKYEYDISILQLICLNQLGIVMEFITQKMESYDIFCCQDDDGNTPFHLLCKKIDISDDYQINSHNSYIFHETTSDHINLFSDYSSGASQQKILDIIRHLVKYVDFSIKNKEGNTPDELTNNMEVHNHYCYQLYLKKRGEFPSKFIKDYGLKVPNLYINLDISSAIDWINFFNFKDSKRKNKTLMHFLCDGDRLGAIQYLVENGADINKSSNEHEHISSTSFHIDDPLICLYHDGIPSGIFKQYNSRIHPELYFQNLNKSEKYILNETESIVKYFINQGVNIDKHLNMNIKSDVIYRFIKKKDNEESDNAKGKEDSVLKEDSKQIINNLQKCENNSSSSLFVETKNNLKPIFSFTENNNDDKTNKTDKIIENNKNNNYNNNPLNNTNPVKVKLNLPSSLWEDLKELSILSGKSIDTLCWESLSFYTKEKLKIARGFGENNSTKK